jgi:hypothetical protein
MKKLIKPLIILVALVGFGYAFMNSLRGTRETPYTIDPRHLQQWTFVIEPGNAPTSVLLLLRPPRELAATLFRQLFTRHAESFNGPTTPFVPLVLQDEFNRSFAGARTSGDLLELARKSGLEQAPLTPRCMGYRRESAPGVTRQLYFVMFDAPAYTRFREQLATLAVPGSGFDPAALSPVMFVAAHDANFGQWLPLRVTESDCVAPISVESGGSN